MTDLPALARSIVNGDMTHPFGIGGYYEAADWRSAAEMALDDAAKDAPDWYDMQFMLIREDAYDRWKERQSERIVDGWDSYEDFETWCEHNAPEAMMKEMV